MGCILYVTTVIFEKYAVNSIDILVEIIQFEMIAYNFINLLKYSERFAFLDSNANNKNSKLKIR